MTVTRNIVSGLIAATVIAGTMMGSAGQASAMSKKQAAAWAGLGGFVLGATIATLNKGPAYHGGHYNSWEAHVSRCYNRYRSYDHRTDTYIGFDGVERYCRL